MPTTNLIAFEKDKILNILDDLNIKTKEVEDKIFLLENETNKVKTCPICEEQITTKNLGNIAKGSHLCFCDNPICFITYLESIRK
jgi:hypothetical protein